MKAILPLVPVFVVFVCSAASANEIQFDELESFVVSQSSEVVSHSFEIDLNSDGENDKLIGVTCGNAGCCYYVFVRTDSKSYSYKGTVHLHSNGFEILRTSHNGMNDLLAYWRLGADGGYIVRYEHDGSIYKETVRANVTSRAFQLLRPSYSE